MKILVLTHSVAPTSGWGRCASDLIIGLREAGYEVVVVKEKDDGGEGGVVLRRGLGLFLSAFRIRKFLRRADVVHVLDGYPNAIIASLANLGIGKKIIVTAIGTYSIEPLYRWKTAWLLAWSYRRAAWVTCISRFTRDQLLARIRLSRISVVNLSIDTKEFSKPHTTQRELLMLSVGALKYRKGYHIAIPAFARAKQQIPNLRYVIVGSQEDSGYTKELRLLAQRCGVENDVEFVPHISSGRLIECYRRASLFILTSVNQGHHVEGFGLVFLEAAAAGLPVIGTRGNGIEDAVSDGYNGLLVAQGDIEASADAMTKILSDRHLWSSMSENSVLWAHAHDLGSMIREYEKLYTT